MSKYIIDLRPDCKVVQQICVSDDNVGVGARSVELFDALTDEYVKENFKDLLDAEYQRGLNDSWECGKKLAWTAKYGGYGELLSDVFGRDDTFDFYEYTPNEAIAKLKAYEEKQKADDEIKVGDEVEVLNSGNKYLIAWFAGTSLCGFAHDGVTCRLQPSDVRKTGRHFDIQSILEAMKHD